MLPLRNYSSSVSYGICQQDYSNSLYIRLRATPYWRKKVKFCLHLTYLSPRTAPLPFTLFFPTNKTRARHCSQSSLLESIRVRFSGSHLTLHEVSSLWNRLNSVWLMGNWLGSSSDTGFDHCPRILLSCFRARKSGRTKEEGETFSISPSRPIPIYGEEEDGKNTARTWLHPHSVSLTLFPPKQTCKMSHQSRGQRLNRLAVTIQGFRVKEGLILSAFLE